MDEDLAIALQLQAEFDRELVNSGDDNTVKQAKVSQLGSPSRPLSLVDESWELTDPNPDVRALFLQFNDQYFWGKLAGVEVRWSPRMTLCAGLCCYEGRGGLCSIRLSTPLLQLRPRKDLIETLLHEMIHALLFVTENNKDHDGHGPEFQKHMHRLNKLTGTNITIYHNFHDEVDHFKQHWWRCDGPCQKRKPYFGFVKRAMNRAPAPRDFWWAEHQRTCGGTYTKVKEPEGYGQKKKGKSSKKEDKESAIEKKNDKTKAGNMDIRIFAGSGFSLTSGSSVKSEGETKLGKSENKVIRKPSATVTKSEINDDLPRLPDDYLPLSQRISQTNHTESSSVYNNMKQDTSVINRDSIKHIDDTDNSSSLLIPNVVQSPTSTKKPVSPLQTKSPLKADANNYFTGSGNVLGSSSSGGTGVLAMLRKKWAAGGSGETTPNRLEIPKSLTSGRKRNSDEFKTSESNGFDFKKMKAITNRSDFDVVNHINCDNLTGNKLGKNCDSGNSNSPSSVHKMQGKTERHVTNNVVVLSDDSESSKKTPCPVCQTKVDLAYINEHLDRCLAE